MDTHAPTGTVEGRFLRDPGCPPSTGTVSFTAVATAPRPDDAPTLPPVAVAQVVNDFFSVELPATEPGWTYHLDIDLNVPGTQYGRSGYRFRRNGYDYIDVPAGVLTELTSMKPTGKKYRPLPVASARWGGEVGPRTYY